MRDIICRLDSEDQVEFKLDEIFVVDRFTLPGYVEFCDEGVAKLLEVVIQDDGVYLHFGYTEYFSEDIGPETELVDFEMSVEEFRRLLAEAVIEPKFR